MLTCRPDYLEATDREPSTGPSISCTAAHILKMLGKHKAHGTSSTLLAASTIDRKSAGRAGAAHDSKRSDDRAMRGTHVRRRLRWKTIDSHAVKDMVRVPSEWPGAARVERKLSNMATSRLSGFEDACSHRPIRHMFLG
jgi:hypothetical protein